MRSFNLFFFFFILVELLSVGPVLDGPLGGTKCCTVQALVEADADLKASWLALSKVEQERKTVFISRNEQLWNGIYYME